MKKIFLMMLILAIVIGSSAAQATDLGVQVIGDNSAATVATSLDDMQIGTSYTLDGYAVATPKEFLIVDCFAQFGETGDFSARVDDRWSGVAENNTDIVYTYTTSGFRRADYRYNDASWMDSGRTAEFIWLVMDVTNLQKNDIDFSEETTVKLIYQDDYEFMGWVRQINYDNLEDVYSDGGISRFNQEPGTYPMTVVLNPAMGETVKMMYSGTYVFGGTIPNYVIEDEKSPLRIEIHMGENDLTYHIRK